MKFKFIIQIILLPFIIGNGYSQSILNGDFENNSGACMINIPNATYNSNMFNSTAFGTFEFIDIVETGCSITDPQNGQFCVYIAISNVDTNFQEAISLDLSSPLLAGTSYTLTFFYSPVPGFDVPAIKTGISSTNNSFGTLIDLIPSTSISGTWAMRTVNFVAPVNAGFITVTVQGSVPNSGVAIDNFELNISSSINDGLTNAAEFFISPTLFNDHINISLNNNKLSEVTLYDISSRKSLQTEFTNSTTINTEQLAKGIYLYEVRSNDSVVKKGKVVKE